MVYSGHNLFRWNNQLFPAPDVGVRSLVLITGFLVIVAIWHLMNHNQEGGISPLCEVTSHHVAHSLSRICRWLLVTSHSLLPRLPILACTFLQTHFNPLLPNPLRIIKMVYRQPCLETLQKICSGRLLVHGSISHLFRTVLSPDNGPMLLLQKPSHPYFLPVVEGTKVGLPHHFGKLLQGEFCLLQAD